MTSNTFKRLNYESHPLPDPTKPFTVYCPSRTSIWTKPPSIRNFTAPIIYYSVPRSSFKSVTVTVSANWGKDYDQGGLIVIIDPEAGVDNNQEKRHRWVKSSIEIVDGAPFIGTVATDRWSDWSLRPLPTADGGNLSAKARIQIKAGDDGSLWVYLVQEDGKLSPVREVTWWGDLEKDVDCWVGVYAARPNTDDSVLEVKFEGLV